MLRFNTFRSERYLRSKFVEGKYLLASEATDLELEVLDLLRKVVSTTLGDVAVEDAFKVERLSDTQILIKPGQAWFKGLPFAMRGGKDQLVTGAVLSLGTVPVGTTATDDSTGLGKVITFNSGSTTPSALYRIVITAREELITEVDDPFLQNVNLTESTSQKIRLLFQLNIVPESLQTETPIPYRDESSASGSVTNFPNSGGMAAPNYVNQIQVTGSAAGNGELIALNPISGSEGIDGRDLEAVIRNNPSLGGGNPIPNSPTAQQAFSNGKLIDSYGNKYHVNAIFNDTVSTQVVIRLDKEPDQPNPQFVNGLPFTLVKREVYVTDDSNGVPQGRLHWAVATLDWDSTDGITHASKVVDLRTSVSKEDEDQMLSIIRDSIKMVGGGNVSFNLTTGMLTWPEAFNLVNPYGSLQSIAAGTAPLIDGGSLAYEMDIDAGGAIGRGTLAVTVSSGGTTATLASVDLSDVRVGNILVDSVGTFHVITEIDNVNDTVTAAPSIATGAATIYKDAFGPGVAPTSKSTFILAVRSGNDVLVGGDDEESDTEDRNLKLVRGGTWSWNVSNELSWNADAFISIPGLTEGRNTIPTGMVTLANDGDVAYVEINRDPGVDDNLTVSVAAIEDVVRSENLLIIARRTGSEVIVANQSTLLEYGQSSKLYAQMSDQMEAFMGGGPADSTDYSSNNYVTDGDSLETAIGDLDAAIGNISWKSSVANFSALPIIGNVDGDNRLTLDTRTVYSWKSSSSAWVEIGHWKSPVANSSSLPTLDNLDGDIRLTLDTHIAYYWETSTTSWKPLNGSNNSAKVVGGGVFTWTAPNLAFTQDMNLEIKGLSYTDNIISSSLSPIVLSASLSVAYVIPNLSPGGPSLSVTVGALSSVPQNAIIIARRIGNDIIIGSSSTKLQQGTSSELYAQESIQSRNTLRSVDYLRSDNIVTWTGTQLEFTSDIILESLNTRLSSIKTSTILTSNSPIVFPSNGSMLYVTIDRTTGSGIVVPSVNTVLPTISNDNQEVMILARRIDVGTEHYLHLPIHKQVLNPGQEVRLGASGASTLNILSVNSNTIAEKNKTYLVDSSGGSLVVTLPPAELNISVTIKDSTGSSSTNNITINPNSSELLDGNVNYVMESDWESVVFISNGTDWFKS
jgi:hypothetical protein